MENLKKIIESKKLKSSDKKPRYGTRKLSVGLVSCMLGYFVFMSPTVVNAQAVEGASVALLKEQVLHQLPNQSQWMSLRRQK